ncbi:MAG TPA: twin-arginine translocase TatA/TatE family subunit [Acidimicrobiales bacterium]
MPFLSPAKLLVILVVALIVLGPDKLPKMAKQIGGLWGDFRRFRERLESDVRGSFPDLPSTETITQAVRSPLSFLDNLAESHSAEQGTTSTVGTGNEPPDVEGDAVVPSSESNRPAGSVQAVEETPGIPDVLIVDQGGIVHQVRSNGRAIPDDPGMN